MSDYWAFTVDDIGLNGYSTEEQLNNILDFCDDNELKSTLFVVPEPEGKRLEKGYIKVLKDAVKRGHEVAQHGIIHDRFEIGIPPEMVMMLPHEGPARKFLAENSDKLAAEHTVEKILDKLIYGKKILEDAVGVEIKGFRPPALQSCHNMFTALSQVFDYSSSTYLQKAGWDLLNGIEYIPEEISMERFISLQKSETLKEFPLTADYTWYLKKENFDKAQALAFHDFDSCMGTGVPFVSLCHVGPVHEGDKGLGFELFKRIIQRSKEKKQKIKKVTLTQLSEEFKIVKK